MQTYVVTGGAGFIGSHVVEFLLAKGAAVRVIDKQISDEKKKTLEGAEFFEIDIRDGDALQEAIKGSDVVIHLAATASQQWTIENPIEAHDINVNGTLAVLEAARQSGVKRVVYGSSAMVYGDQETELLSEDLLPRPQTPYALHKVMCEHMMKLWSELYDIETVSVRILSTYGCHYTPEGPYPLVIGTFLELQKQEKPLTITGDGTQTRDFIHGDDVAAGIFAAATADTVGRGEIINLGTGTSTSLNKLAELIGGTVEYIPARIEPKNTRADITKAKELLNWEPTVSIEEGIRQLKEK